MYNQLFNIKIVQIKADQSTYNDRLHLSNKNDVIPENMTINFSKNYLEQAISALDMFPEIEKLSFQAQILSDGKSIIQSEIIIHNKSRKIYASCTNDVTGTLYKLDITSDVLNVNQPAINDKSSNTTVRRKSPFQFAKFGRCIALDISHVPDDDLEQLIATVLVESPVYYRDLLIDFFILPEFFGAESFDGIGIQFYHQPWQVIDAKKFFEICELKNIPKSIAELILQAGMDGLDIVTIAPYQQKVERLATYTDEFPKE